VNHSLEHWVLGVLFVLAVVLMWCRIIKTLTGLLVVALCGAVGCGACSPGVTRAP
jgi:hypothetical protein